MYNILNSQKNWLWDYVHSLSSGMDSNTSHRLMQIHTKFDEIFCFHDGDSLIPKSESAL